MCFGLVGFLCVVCCCFSFVVVVFVGVAFVFGFFLVLFGVFLLRYNLISWKIGKFIKNRWTEPLLGI